jgi:hypothetical protein
MEVLLKVKPKPKHKQNAVTEDAQIGVQLDVEKYSLDILVP